MRAAGTFVVRVLSRPTANTLMVMWRETAICCYQEQKWIRRTPRVRGNAPFRSRPSRQVPECSGLLVHHIR
jgi:hypothetical protein